MLHQDLNVMSAVLSILVFVAFITYGVSEHVLIVSLHNIRVFIARMCNGIVNLFNKKVANDNPEYNNVWDEKKQQATYRSYKREENNSREHNLLAQVRELEQEGLDLKKQNREIAAQYKGRITSLTNQINDYKSKTEKLSA